MCEHKYKLNITFNCVSISPLKHVRITALFYLPSLNVVYQVDVYLCSELSYQTAGTTSLNLRRYSWYMLSELHVTTTTGDANNIARVKNYFQYLSVIAIVSHACLCV